jgi:hypothetical protein
MTLSACLMRKNWRKKKLEKIENKSILRKL